MSIGRRFFLRILGATGVAAGCSPAHAPEKLIPLLVPPENLVPGKPLFYRTACRECAAGCGVTARSREGRVVKLEGNPDEPISQGALCARGQAALQALYAPDRFRGPMLRGADGKLQPIGWDAALARLADALKAAPAGSVRLLTRSEPGWASDVQRAVMAPLGQRVVVEAPSRMSLREGCRIAYGRAELPAYELSAARSVAAFGADFAETWLSPVELARGFAAGRGKQKAQRTSLAWVGPRIGATGAGADQWVACRAGSERDVALLLLRWIATNAADLQPEAAAVKSALAGFDAAAAARRAGVGEDEIARLGRLVSEKRPSALLGSTSPDVAALLLVANHLLGNLGRTVLLGQDPLRDPPTSPAAKAHAGVLLLHHADPPEGASADFVVSFSSRPDAGTELAHLVLPDHHWLESAGEVEARKGLTLLSQPAMTPLYDTRSASEVLLQIGKRLGTGGLPGPRPRPDRAAQMRGVTGSVAPHAPSALLVDSLRPLLEGGSPVPDAPALFAFPSALQPADPHAPPWLREVPDAVSGVCWSSWVELSPADAARLGAKDGDLIALGEVTLPLSVHKRLRDGTVAVPESAPELRRLRGPLSPRKVGRGVLPRIPGTPDEMGRDLLPGAAAIAAREEHVHGHEHGHDKGIGYEHPPEEHPYGMRPPPSHPAHRWAMAIDLDRCTGCQACVVACYAENNVPVNGPEAALAGRNQAWLRIQRSESARGISFLPSLCQQCDRAPCEPVCPVYATYHTGEGLNAMVYNRCIGTRYCSNNCPYDARVFNWRDPKFEEPLDLQLNPDVTVRSKGVMEKCTFCVQRIRFAENEAKNERRNVVDGEVVPACAQTCPSRAITFGDLEDPGARINRVRQDPRAYRLLEDLATGPAVTYLARGGES
ncbi:MAG TPA: 4Fe-4S dicluster domain-containing protein [Myxococcales bacterium]